jgi:hypothetical protein
MVLHHFSGMRIFFLKFINFSDSERSEESETLDNQRFRFFASLRMTKREELPKAIPEKW